MTHHHYKVITSIQTIKSQSLMTEKKCGLSSYTKISRRTIKFEEISRISRISRSCRQPVHVHILDQLCLQFSIWNRKLLFVANSSPWKRLCQSCVYMERCLSERCSDRCHQRSILCIWTVQCHHCADSELNCPEITADTWYCRGILFHLFEIQ